MKCLLFTIATAAAVRPLPRWQFNSSADARLPVGWFGSNKSGFENESQMLAIAEYSFVIFGWQAFLQNSNYTHESSNLVKQAKRVKERYGATTAVAIYLDAELAEPFETSVGAVMNNPLYEDYFLRRDNAPITCNTFCRQMPGISHEDPRCLAYYWNWFNSSAIDFYLDQYVGPVVEQDGFDAVFFDGADEWMEQASHTWAVADNVPKNMSYANLSARALQLMMDVRVRTSELLVKNGKYPLISEHLDDTNAVEQAYIASRMADVGYFRYFEFFSPTQHYIESLLNETQRGSAERPLPLVCRQDIIHGLDLVDSIAAFLVIMSNYSYYSASTGWFDDDWQWHEEYDPIYGRPLGPATQNGMIYTRNFTGCDVMVNCTASGRGNCKGTIIVHDPK